MLVCEFNPVFKSQFADKLQAFLRSKRAIGYRYESESHILSRIDKHLCEINCTALTEDVINELTTKRIGESDKTHSSRVSILKQFCLFLNRHGVVVALPQRTKNHGFSKTFTPYIFTRVQIQRILHSADTMPKSLQHPNSNHYKIMPIILRLLYCCGLRINEALSLRVENIDLKRGIITIKHGKNDDCRNVPMSESLNQCFAEYLAQMYVVPKDNDFVFPTSKGELYCSGVIYSHFRELLWLSNIPHGGRGNGPRLHDIRHTFAVHSLQNLILKGKDTYLLLPILSTYLGHKSIYATEKYLRLTSEMYPDILEKVETALGKLVPEVVDYED